MKDYLQHWEFDDGDTRVSIEGRVYCGDEVKQKILTLIQQAQSEVREEMENEHKPLTLEKRAIISQEEALVRLALQKDQR